LSAYAYLRKSSVRDPSREVSHEVQEAAVRELAHRHGDNDGSLTILSDWDKSGRLGADKRPGYRALLDAIESGRCTAVYSYSLSRLGRSVPELSRLIADCNAREIPVRIAVDAVDTSTASGRLLTHVLASVAAFEADVASERVRAAQAAKLARGERIGTATFYGEKAGEDMSAVLAAFTEAGSYSGAARLLNQRGVKPRNSGRGWWPSSVAVIMRRMAPQAVRASTRGARAGGSDFMLAGLLRCPTCGTRLTGTRDRRDTRVRYSCRLGSVTPHQRVSISEHLILPAIRKEADRLRTPEQLEAMQDDAGQRAELEARKVRILDMYESGRVDRAERERRLTAVDEKLVQLDTRRIVQAIPRIEWDWPPRELSAVLRALFARVDLDPVTFQPIAFQWSVPEWRA
jgi:DNA invertase Pin-like site-specific DNA recombinase